MHAPEHRGRQSIRPCLAAIDEALSSALMRTERARLCTCATPAESRSLLSEPARSPCRASTRSVSTHMTLLEHQQLPGPLGSLDADGAGDHDQPYRFGWWPRASVPYPFNTRQYARLLVLRSRLQDGVAGEVEADGTSSLAAAA